MRVIAGWLAAPSSGGWRLEGCEILVAGRDQVNLTDQAAVRTWMRANRPNGIFLAAAKVGGIHANNTMPGDFLYENLAIEINVIRSAYEEGVEKLLFLGSSCIYPKFAPQPIVEESLLTGLLEPTNEAYAIAKIAGIKLCQAMRTQYNCDYISAQPTNLYGPGDNYNLETSHVLPALLRKFHEARKARSQTVTLWGTGSPLREFLHVDDLADALVFLFKTYSGEVPINVGSQEEVTIRDLAYLIADVVGYEAELVFDDTKPDGTPTKADGQSQAARYGLERGP